MEKKALNENQRSILYNTILGILAGSSAASLYALMGGNDKYMEDDNSGANRIVIPLSKSHFMRAVQSKKPDSKERIVAARNTLPQTAVDQFTPQELAAFKRNLLRNATTFRKSAEKLPQSIEKKTVPAVSSSSMKSKSGSIAARVRDEKGKFSTESKLENICEKKAFLSFLTDPAEEWWGAVKDYTGNYVGLAAGLFAGTVGTKMLYDRIMLNRQRKNVEKARRVYAGLINNDIQSTQEKSAQTDNPLITIPGDILSFGVGTAALSALVLYKVMEKRRKALEQEADKDTSKFPLDKTIEYKLV